MYKVVLVDDEALIVEGLRKVVDWAGHNCQVAATARDAVSGAQAIRLGVARFLLKPSKMDELEEALDYMTGQLDRLPPRGKRGGGGQAGAGGRRQQLYRPAG